MYDTVVTLVGNVATGVEFKESPAGGVARFRFAVTERRWDRRNEAWADGPTSFYTVWAWRTLGANLAASVSVGEPLVVHGRLRVREEEWEGRRRTSVDVEATAAGHDLTRGTSAFRRVARASPALTERRVDVPGANRDTVPVRARPADAGPAPGATAASGAPAAPAHAAPTAVRAPASAISPAVPPTMLPTTVS
jgi:single-strand DNA-binding protein